jgi:hypothetical protein
MNRSYSKIRHIQESNLRLEKRMLNEDNDYSFLKQKLSTIKKLIDKYVNKVKEEEIMFADKYEFVDNIISSVVNNLTKSGNEEYDYEEIKKFVKDNFGEYILSQFTVSMMNLIMMMTKDEDYDDYYGF